jgi:hypothetical protein
MVLGSRSLPSPLPVVCFATGDLYGMAELYVSRLHGMLERHCPQAFRLHCYTDRPRSLPAAMVEQRDCSGWSELLRPGMRPTTRKLGMFNPAYVEFEHFFYFDLTLIVRRNLDEMLTYAFGRPEDLVILPHWKREGYNSAVMCIRRGGLRSIYDAFVAGEQYDQYVLGDQEFIQGVVARHGLQDRVALFPAHQVVSFRLTARAGRREPARIRREIEAATIVKFNGEPKMHEAFGLPFRLQWRLKELVNGNLRPVMPMAQLHQEWIGTTPA